MPNSVCILLITLVSLPSMANSPAPEKSSKTKWEEWSQSLKDRYKEKFSAPSITHHIYLDTDGEEAFLDLERRYPRLVKSDCKKCPVKIKRLNIKQVQLTEIAGKRTIDLEMGKENRVLELKDLYLSPVTYEAESKIRVFVHDLSQKKLAHKKERKFYPWQEDKILKAEVEWLSKPEKVTIQRSDGSQKEMSVQGRVHYELNGKKGSLSIYDFGNPDFKESNISMLMYRDYSNGKKTYGAGRFLNLYFPGKMKDLKKTEKVTLDFNYSYNPPCAVSTGFHCPLPQDFVKSDMLVGEQYNK